MLKKNQSLRFDVNDYEFEISFKKWCKFTNSTILFEVTHNKKKTSILCNIIVEDSAEKSEFINLNINYREPSYVIGKVSSGKRDRQSERETLISRTIDKTIRPLLSEIQNKSISINLMMLNFCDSLDISSISSMAAIFALKKIYNINCAVCKISISKDENITFLPSIDNINESDGNVMLSANDSKIYFLDVECNNFSNKKICQYIKKCIEFCEQICKKLQEITSDNEIIEIKPDMSIFNTIDQNFDGFKLSEELKISYEQVRKTASAIMFKNEKRIDQRDHKEIREILVEKGPINRCHNVVFIRGETTVLGSINQCSEKINIGETIKEEQNIISIYNFPGFAVGELYDKRLSRREIGHGDLIRAAFQKIIHKSSLLRFYSEVLSSNGSSSMASVCAISCAAILMGVLQEMIAGISIGMLRDEKKEIYITDITEFEDKYGEMDFKITGTSNGISAIRADVKSYILVKNLPKIIKQGEDALKQIIKKVDDLGFKNENEIINLEIDKKKLGLLIGSNGKNIKEFSFRCNCKIKVTQDGNVCILGKDIELATMLVKTYQEEDKIKNKETIALLIKEDSSGENIISTCGEFKLAKKIELKKGEIIIVKVKDIKNKSISFVKKYDKNEEKTINKEELSEKTAENHEQQEEKTENTKKDQ